MCISLYYGYYLRSLGFGASLRDANTDGLMLTGHDLRSLGFGASLRDWEGEPNNSVSVISEVSASELH